MSLVITSGVIPMLPPHKVYPLFIVKSTPSFPLQLIQWDVTQSNNIHNRTSTINPITPPSTIHSGPLPTTKRNATSIKISESKTKLGRHQKTSTEGTSPNTAQTDAGQQPQTQQTLPKTSKKILDSANSRKPTTRKVLHPPAQKTLFDTGHITRTPKATKQMRLGDIILTL
jgi:hypothetical protein